MASRKVAVTTETPIAPPSTEPTTTSAPVTPPPTVVATIPNKTVRGHSISFAAFIAIDPKDYKTQSEVMLLLHEVEKGFVSIAELAPYLKKIDLKVAPTSKRVTQAEYDELFRPAEKADEKSDEASETGSANAPEKGAEPPTVNNGDEQGSEGGGEEQDDHESEEPDDGEGTDEGDGDDTPW